MRHYTPKKPNCAGTCDGDHIRRDDASISLVSSRGQWLREASRTGPFHPETSFSFSRLVIRLISISRFIAADFVRCLSEYAS